MFGTDSAWQPIQSLTDLPLLGGNARMANLHLSKRPKSCTHGATIRGHQMPEYAIWASMWNRCVSPGAQHFERYGGRGIKVCDRWKDFTAFIEDIGQRPAPHLTLDRKDNDGDYTPDNCRWADRRTQQRNRAIAPMLLTVKGETKYVGDWADELGVTTEVIYSRLKRGWSHERAVTTPLLTNSRPHRPRTHKDTRHEYR